MTSIFSKDVFFSSKWYQKTSFQSKRRNHIDSYVFRTPLTRADVFLKVSHSHKSPPKRTTYTWYYDFFKKRRLWRNRPFQKSRLFSHGTDAFSRNWHPFENVRFLKRHPLIWNSSVQVDFETRPIGCGNQQLFNTILFQNKHKILTYFLIWHTFYLIIFMAYFPQLLCHDAIKNMVIK
jgi:hypothetical protein